MNIYHPIENIPVVIVQICISVPQFTCTNLIVPAYFLFLSKFVFFCSIISPFQNLSFPQTQYFDF